MIEWSNDAADQLPVRLLLSLVIVGAIIALVAGASGTLRIYLAEQQVESQCRALVASLSTMTESGAVRDVDDLSAAEGTKRVHTLTLPDSLVFLCFGGNPSASDTGVFSSELLEDGAVISYKVQGGSTQVIWLPIETYKYRKGAYIDHRWTIQGEGHNLVIQKGGVVSLVFERIQKNHKSCILVHINTDTNR